MRAQYRRSAAAGVGSQRIRALKGPASGRTDAVVLETFEHTGPRPLWPSLPGRLRDGARLVRLAEALLRDP